MSALREPVSPETIQRAIRARLVTAFGAHSPYVVLPLNIHQVPTGANGVNWELMIPQDDTASEAGIHAALDAASDVAGSFNLDRGLH